MEQEYIGNVNQLFEVRPYRMVGGRSEGTLAVDIWNGGDLSFTVVPDRGMDIFTLRYKGHNLSYLTPAGSVAPQYYNDVGSKWLRSFGGGFFVTCGLQNIGNSDTVDKELSVHGRMSNTPAENFCIEKSDDGCSVKLTGTMREAIIFGVKLSMKRTIECARGENKITITDVITNLDFRPAPISILYHFNMGYPLLSESAVPYIPANKSIPRDEHAATDPDWKKVLSPVTDFQEMCWYHYLDEKVIGIDNPDIDTSVRIAFDSPILDRVVQWRMFGASDYVMGLEPASCTLEGRTDAVENGSQKYIDARSTITNRLVITFDSLKK